MSDLKAAMFTLYHGGFSPMKKFSIRNIEKKKKKNYSEEHLTTERHRTPLFRCNFCVSGKKKKKAQSRLALNIPEAITSVTVLYFKVRKRLIRVIKTIY